MLTDLFVDRQAGGGDPSLLGASEPSSPFLNDSLLGKIINVGTQAYSVYKEATADPNQVMQQSDMATKSTPQPLPAKEATAGMSTYIYLIVAAVLVLVLFARR